MLYKLFTFQLKTGKTYLKGDRGKGGKGGKGGDALI